jgi:hypothetical protein
MECQLISKIILFFLLSIALTGCSVVASKKDLPTPLSAQVMDLRNNGLYGDLATYKDYHRIRKTPGSDLSANDERQWLENIDLWGLEFRKDKSQREIAKHNTRISSYYREYESQYYPSMRDKKLIDHYSRGSKQNPWPKGLPRVCVAMSGGGIRSAAFNIGVLQALAEKGLLDQVDVFSAVSGGSYALSWIYAHLTLDSRIKMHHILSDKSPAMRNTENLLPFINTPKLLNRLTVAAPFTPLLFGIEKASAPMGIYQPGAGNLIYTTQLILTFHSNNDISNDQIRDVVKEKIVPVPIFNVTSLRQDDVKQSLDYSTIPLSELVFEFTPFRRGNFALGYSDRFPGGPIDKKEILLAETVALSGAALDDVNSSLFSAMRLVEMHLGASEGYISAPLLESLVETDTKATYVDDTQFYKNYISYSDGGFSENLGLYSLVRRSCENILVVDAEEDPGLIFESYTKLQDRLMIEHGLSMEVSGIENLINNNSDANRCSGKNAWNRECFRARSSRVNVYEGEVRSIPHLMSDGDENIFEAGHPVNLTLKIHYIKLAIDQNNPGKYSKELREYIGDCLKKGAGCQFPHHNTRNQELNREDFRAYRMLGRDIGRQYLNEKISYLK